jgi:hypothetical protein
MALGSTQTLNRNEYQEYFLGGKVGRCVGLTTLPPSCADCLEIVGASTSWNTNILSSLYRDCFTFHYAVSIMMLSKCAY